MAGSQRSVEERNDKWHNHIDDLLENGGQYRIGCRKIVRKLSNGVDDVISGGGEKARNATSTIPYTGAY